MSLIASYNKVNSIPAVFDLFFMICWEYKWQLMHGKCFYLWFGKHYVLSMFFFFGCRYFYPASVGLSCTDGFWRLWRSFATCPTCDSNDFVNAESHAREKPLLATTGTLFHKEILVRLVRLHYAARVCAKKALRWWAMRGDCVLSL